MQDTAVGHYRSFVGATRCLADLRTQLAAAAGHLDALAADLPKLQAACDAFRQDAAAIAGRRADNHQLYSEPRCCRCWRGLGGRVASNVGAQPLQAACLSLRLGSTLAGAPAAFRLDDVHPSSPHALHPTTHPSCPPLSTPRRTPSGAGGAGGAAAHGHLLPLRQL